MQWLRHPYLKENLSSLHTSNYLTVYIGSTTQLCYNRNVKAIEIIKQLGKVSLMCSALGCYALERENKNTSYRVWSQPLKLYWENVKQFSWK